MQVEVQAAAVVGLVVMAVAEEVLADTTLAVKKLVILVQALREVLLVAEAVVQEKLQPQLRAAMELQKKTVQTTI